MSEVWMKKLAKPILFTAAFIYGTSFFIMKDVLDAVPVQFLLAMRFTVAAVLLGLICWKKWKLMTVDYLWRGAVIGGFLYLASTVQNYGLQYTTPSKNAFLTAVYCVLVPFLYWLIARIRPDRFNILAALLCISGVGLVSLNGDLSVNIGDLLTLLCAVFFAAHIVAVTKLSGGKDIYLISILQFAYVGLFSWIGGLLTEQFPAEIFSRSEVMLPMVYLSVVVTMMAFSFQNIGQIYSDPSSAAVILSLESVFGVLCSVIFYHDVVTAPMAIGFALIFVAVVCSETKFSFLRRH